MFGHHLGQLFLRFALAATFLVAGLAKMQKDAYEGEAAAALANMGVITKPTAPVPGEGETNPAVWRQAEAQPEEPAASPPARSTTPAQSEGEIRSLSPRAEPEEAPAPAVTAPPAPKFTAADFPTPVELPGVYRIALLLHASAHPAPNEDGTARMALVPAWAADSKVPGLGMATPVVLAWVAAITEIVGGGMLLVGFMSRLWALGIVGVIVTAIWLTTIGPAIQSGTAFLGFLPGHSHIFAFTEHGYAYTKEFWQMALACMSLAVMLAGPGAISVDGLLFGGGSSSDSDED